MRPQGKVERHAGIWFELVAALDAPVLQMDDPLVDFLQFFDTSFPVVAEHLTEQSSTAFGSGGLPGFRPGQGSAASSSFSHSPAGVLDTADEPFDGFFFSHFSPAHKKCVVRSYWQNLSSLHTQWHPPWERLGASVSVHRPWVARFSAMVVWARVFADYGGCGSIPHPGTRVRECPGTPAHPS